MTRSADFPLSGPQRQIWSAELMEPGSSAYRIPLLLEFRGTLDGPSLVGAINDLVTAHEALRTLFPTLEDGSPVQRIFVALPPDIQAVTLPEQGWLDTYIQECMAHPLDPAERCFRARIIGVSDDVTFLFLDIHHLVSDGWSLSVIAEDLQRFYTTRSLDGEAHVADPDSFQYLDWSEWRRNMQPNEDALAFWRARAPVGETGDVRLAFSVTGDATQSDVVTAEIDGFAWSRIVEAARVSGVSLFEFCATAFGGYLGERTGQATCLVATPVANRETAEFARTVGCFVDTSVLCLTVAHDAPFAEQLARTAEELRTSIAHGSVGLQNIKAAWRDVGVEDHAPRIMLAVQAPHPALDGFPGLAVTPVPLETGGAKNDLTLRIEPQGPSDGATLRLEYRKTLLDTDTATTVLNDIMRLFSHCALRPRASITEASFSWCADVERESEQGPDQSVSTIDDAAPLASILPQVCAGFVEILGRPAVEPDENFFALGGDSIQVLRLSTALRKMGLDCRARDVFRNPTPAGLAAALLAAAPNKGTVVSDADASKDHGAQSSHDLLPIEHWFFSLGLENPNHWVQGVCIALDNAPSSVMLEQALQRVHESNPVFRHRWQCGAAGMKWREDPNGAVLHFDLLTGAADPGNESSALIDKIDIAQGPLSAAGWSQQDCMLVWFIHHLAVDNVSWSQLITELLAGLSEADAPAHAPTSRYKRIARSVVQASDAAQEHWASVHRQIAELPTFPGARALYGQVRRHEAMIDLRPLNAPGGLVSAGYGYDEILLTALASLAADVTGGDALALTLEHHGRDEDAGIGATEIGWFTTLAPLFLRTGSDQDAPERLGDIVADLAAWKAYAPTWLPIHASDKGTKTDLPSFSFNNLGDLGGAGTLADTRLLPLPDVAFHDPGSPRHFAHELLFYRDGDDGHLVWLGPPEDECPEIPKWLEALKRHIGALADLGRDRQFLPAGPLAPGLMFHSDDPGRNPHYIQQVIARLTGPIDMQRMRLAWSQCADRHASLRSAFEHSDDGQLRRVVWSDVGIPLRIVDLSRSGGAADDLLRQALSEEMRRPFNMMRPPLFRVLLVRFGPNEWAVGFTHHHVILDGWSLPLLFRTLLACYGDPDLALRPDTAGLLSMAREQAERATDEEIEQEWRSVLAERVDPGRLPIQPGDGDDADIDVTLSAALIRRLELRAAQAGVSQSSWYLGAWALALQAFGAGRTPTFGMTVSGREPGAEDLVGLSANTLPFMIEVRPDEPFAAFCRRVHERSAMVQTSSHLDLTHVCALGQVTPNDLLQSLFVYENYPVGRLSDGEFELSGVEMVENSHYPMALAVIPQETVRLRLTLRGKAIPKTAGKALLKALVAVIEQVCADPDLRCGQIRRVSVTQLVDQVAAGRGAVPAGEARSLYEILLNTATRHPKRMAVIYNQEPTTYADLLDRVDRVGSAIQRLDLPPNALIAVTSARHAHWIVLLAAISRSGHAFLNLDPGLSVKRRTDLLLRSGAACVIHDPASAFEVDGIPAIPARRLLSSTTAKVPPAPTHPMGLAYALFTSGSTGLPKLVAVPQAGLRNLAEAQADQCGVGPDDRIYQFASPTFDATISEILMALSTGAALCLPTDGRPIPEIDLVADLEQTRATHVTLPPSLLSGLPLSSLYDLRAVIVAGERSGAHQLAAARAAGLELHNGYGPTEATVCATMQPVLGDGDPAIGTPIMGQSVYVLSPDLGMLIPGSMGEIAIDGNLAWGYLGDPRRTAERFVPNPYTHTAGARIYLTGDLGKARPDGAIDFKGRIDRQIKVRGQRIEPGEIESVLERSEDVLSARVAVIGEAERAELVCWIQPRDGTNPDFTDLSTTIAETLQATMAPRRWAMVREWPLNTSGKVDIPALPEPLALTSGGPANVEDGDDPEILNQVIDAWAKTLGGDVGPDQAFLDAGGNSILAMQLAARLQIFGMSLKARDLLSGLTPRQMSRMVALQPDPRVQNGATSAPLAPMQAAFLKYHGPDVPRWLLSFELELDPNIDMTALAAAIDETVRRHPALCAHVSPVDEEQALRGAPTGVVTLHDVPSPEAYEVARSTIDPQHGCNVVAVLAAGDQPRMFLAAHHLVCDVVSLRLLADEIAARIENPAMTIGSTASYLDWSAAIREAARSGAFHDGLPNWIREASSIDHVSWPVPGPPPSERDVTHALHSFRLDDGHVRDLASIEAALLQAMAQHLASERAPDLFVECERHGRDALARMDMSTAVGWFTAAFPVRVRHAADPRTAAEALEKKLASEPCGGAGFQALRMWTDDIGIRSTLDRLASACGVSFNFLGHLDDAAPADKTALGHLLRDDQQATADIAPDIRRFHPLSVNAWIAGATLYVRWTYDPTHWPEAEDRQSDVMSTAFRILDGRAVQHGLAGDEFDALVAELGGAVR